MGVIVNLVEFYFPSVRSHGKEVFTTWWVDIQLFRERYSDVPRYVCTLVAHQLFNPAKPFHVAFILLLPVALALVPVGFILMIPGQTSMFIAGKPAPSFQPDALAYVFFFLFLAVPSVFCSLLSHGDFLETT